MNLRLATQHKETISAAARVRGVSFTDFMVQTALDEANAVLADQRVFHVSDSRWDELDALMQAPVEPNPGLVRLFSHPSVFEA